MKNKTEKVNAPKGVFGGRKEKKSYKKYSVGLMLGEDIFNLIVAQAESIGLNASQYCRMIITKKVREVNNAQ